MVKDSIPLYVLKELLIGMAIPVVEFSREGYKIKGQLISKCLFGVNVWTKIATKIL